MNTSEFQEEGNQDNAKWRREDWYTLCLVLLRGEEFILEVFLKWVWEINTDLQFINFSGQA